MARILQPCHIRWQGIAIEITYEPNWLNLESLGVPVAHLTISAESRQALPITATGYLSHYPNPASIDEAGGAAAYVTTWLDHAAESEEWQGHCAAGRQLVLF